MLAATIIRSSSPIAIGARRSISSSSSSGSSSGSFITIRAAAAAAAAAASGAAAMSSSSTFSRPRLVVKKILGQEQSEGDGAVVRRSIGRPELKSLDPFLMLDYFTVTPPAGFPDHPHRGFETVTYMLEGSFTHQDFAGHRGTIKAGDLQWMTAGRGIVHCEMPASRGVQRGLQLWVNLASKFKMIDPNYQELEAKDIPVAEGDGVRVLVIAGESLGTASRVYTRTPTLYLDVTMQPGASFHQPIPEGWNALVYTLQGRTTLGEQDMPAFPAHYTLQLGHGNGISAWNNESEVKAEMKAEMKAEVEACCRFVLIAGQPLNEPVYQHGPFVMNSREEIVQTIRDYQACTNGFERARHWRSDAVTL